MTDRDHFAAAALTGLLHHDAAIARDDTMARKAYEIADFMLRERGRTNLDAAPAARANAESVAPQPTAGDRSGDPTSHSGTGKQPAPPCVETDGFSPGSRTGQINRTPEREPPRQQCGESSLRDVPRPDTKGKATGGPEPKSMLDVEELLGELHHIAGSEDHVEYDIRRTACEAEHAIDRLRAWVNELQLSKVEIDALQHVVEDGRLVDLADYGRLRSLLVRLRPEWEQEDGESDRPEPIKNAEFDRPQPIATLVEVLKNELASLRGDAEIGRLRLEAAHAEIARLRLTDAEREAIEAAIAYMAPVANYDSTVQATLRGLLERLA